MALQLIDLNEDVEYIDIDVSKVPYSFSIKLTDKTYTFTVKYNEVGKFLTSTVTCLCSEKSSGMAGRCSTSWKTSGFRCRSSSPSASRVRQSPR